MTALTVYRGLLRNPRLTRLLAGEFISSIGDWLYLVALLVVVYRASTDPILLGIVGAARVLPYVVLSVPAGLVADRFDRRLVLIVTDLARGAIMVVLAWLVAVDGPLWSIVGLAIVATCFSAFFGPTIGSFLPTLVTNEAELGPANSAWSSLETLAFVIGPAVGGLLIGASSLAFAFLLNALSFAIVAAVLWRLPSGTPASGAQVSSSAPVSSGASASGASASGASASGAVPAFLADAQAGSGMSEFGNESAPAAVTSPRTDDRTAPDEPGSSSAGVGVTPAEPRGPAELRGPVDMRAFLRPLFALTLIDVAAAFVFGGLSILTVVIATRALGAGDELTGYLNAAAGVGGVVGAVGAGALVLRPRLGPALILGAIGLGAGLAVLGAVPIIAIALAAMTVAAAGDLVIEVVSTTIFQRVVPDEVRGRALGGRETLATLAYAAGSLALPILADGIGVSVTLIGGGLAIFVATVAATVLLGTVANRADDATMATLRHISRLPIFAGIAPARIEAAFRELVRVPVTTGDVVIQEGDPADRFYIIEDGRFDVTQADVSDPGRPRLLRQMGPDEVFGEIGLLTAAPRTATVTASTPGMLLAIPGPAFLELVGTGAGLASRLLDLHRGASTPGASQATAPLSGT